MAAVLFGLDCSWPDCIHPKREGYRMDFWVRLLRPTAFTDAQWEQRARVWERERNPVVFRSEEYASALDQLAALGVATPASGVFELTAAETKELPPGYDRRRIALTVVPLPRTACYFRWQPDVGQVLTPDLVVQCHFPPGATVAERQMAAEVPIPPEVFTTVLRQPERWGQDAKGRPSPIEQVARMSILTCQHCHRPLPLRAFHTQALRQVEKGD